MRVITFQKQFVEPILKGRKSSTIRSGEVAAFIKRFPLGVEVSLRYWSDRPYHSPQVEFARATIVGIGSIRFNLATHGFYYNGRPIIREPLLDAYAQIDGFKNFPDMVVWFEKNYGEVDFHGARIQFKATALAAVEGGG